MDKAMKEAMDGFRKAMDGVKAEEARKAREAVVVYAKGKTLLVKRGGK